MTKIHELCLWFKRTFQVGWFTSIEADKCSSHITDEECPNPSTCYEYHRGQFGHKVKFMFCDSCYKTLQDYRSGPDCWLVPNERKFVKI